MSQNQKRPRKDPYHQRCDSCGSMHSYRFHNHGFLCFECYNLDKRGFPRAKDGTIVTSEEELKLLNKLYERRTYGK